MNNEIYNKYYLDLISKYGGINIYLPCTLSPWELKYLNLCDYKAQSWSKDPSSKYGSIIVDQFDNEVSSGINGFPRGFKDTKERWEDREFKKRHVIHSEENAILFAERSLVGCRIFVNGLPCSSCMGKIAQKKIKEVICWEPPEQFYERYSPAESLQVAMECEISVKIILREDNNE